jgi:hypothetical protein
MVVLLTGAVYIYFTGMKEPMKTTIQTLSIGFTLKKEKDCSVLDRTSWVRNMFKYHCNQMNLLESVIYVAADSVEHDNIVCSGRVC